MCHKIGNYSCRPSVIIIVGRHIDILLDLSVDNEVGSQIIEAYNEYGAEYVIDTLLGNVSDF